jgi:hypothetical protein
MKSFVRLQSFIRLQSFVRLQCTWKVDLEGNTAAHSPDTAGHAALLGRTQKADNRQDNKAQRYVVHIEIHAIKID